MLPKLLYSAILLSIIAIFAVEFYKLWFDRRVRVSPFVSYKDTKLDTSTGEAFAQNVRHQYIALTRLLATEVAERKIMRTGNQSASPEGIDSTWLPHEIPNILPNARSLDDMEVNVQGINVTKILSAARHWVSTPNEVSGQVMICQSGCRASVIWPQGPAPCQAQLFDAASENTTALRVAASIAWGQVWRTFHAAQCDEFVDWVDGWMALAHLRTRSRSLSGLEQNHVAELRRIAAFADRVITSSKHPVCYRELYRFRADALELVPALERTAEEQKAIVEDRLAYSTGRRSGTTNSRITTDPLEASNVESEKALFEARPRFAFVPSATSESTLSPAWRNLLEPHWTNVRRAGAATGMIYNQDRGSVGPGVAVGNGWILTAGMIVEDSVSDSTNINFRFSFDETPEVAASIPVIEVRRLGESLEDPALLRIAEHDIRANPPLKIWSGSLDSAVGRVVMAVGYPEVSEKAIMPGRITRRSDVSGDDAQLFGDLNTARGVGGGPIVDLLTGDIVAVHLGGSMEPGAGRVTFHKALTGWQQRIEAKISQSSDPRQTGDRD